MLDIISSDKFMYMPTLRIKIAEGEWIQLIFREGLWMSELVNNEIGSTLKEKGKASLPSF